MRPWPAAVACLLLAACDPAAPAGPPVTALSLMGGAVTVQGPEGYCIDRAASRTATGLAVLSPCAVMAGGPQTAAADIDGFVTVQIGAAGSAAVEGAERPLADLLMAAPGAALLSTSGEADGVRVVQVDRGDGLVAVRFTDAAPPPVPGLGPEEWRAFLDLRGRLVTVGVRGSVRAPLTGVAAQQLLYDTVAVLRRVNN